jgi:crotonobetainyl-CoA:carnitine CoA-transferase CaiB-like acyl-CoA transferase
MDYDTVSKINPGIIYASITGYGQTGPYRNRAGYDVMVEAYIYPDHFSRVMSYTDNI